MFISRFYARYLPALMLILILVASAFAFAASNTVDESGLGEGTGDISGYNITGIRYTLDTTGNPSTITAVTFNAVPLAGAPDPNTVQIQIDGGSWIACSAGVGNSWSCTVNPAVNVTSATTLRVLAHE
ncbi:MAG: hypothetical protein AB8I58_06735 [Anaerolineales bacterium]|jgi:predicted small secreted protein